MATSSCWTAESSNTRRISDSLGQPSMALFTITWSPALAGVRAHRRAQDECSYNEEHEVAHRLLIPDLAHPRYFVCSRCSMMRGQSGKRGHRVAEQTKGIANFSAIKVSPMFLPLTLRMAHFRP